MKIKFGKTDNRYIIDSGHMTGKRYSRHSYFKLIPNIQVAVTTSSLGKTEEVYTVLNWGFWRLYIQCII